MNVVGCLQGTTPGHMVQQPVPQKREPVARPLRFNNKQLKPTRSIATRYISWHRLCVSVLRKRDFSEPRCFILLHFETRLSPLHLHLAVGAATRPSPPNFHHYSEGILTLLQVQYIHSSAAAQMPTSAALSEEPSRSDGQARLAGSEGAGESGLISIAPAIELFKE